nr:EpsG family protein [uncultured Macellibacteroides sp.]
MNLSLLLLFFTVGVILTYTRKLYVKHTYIYLSIILSIFIGMRDLSVPDTEGYLEFFEQTLSNSLLDIPFFSFEPGFQLFTKLSKNIIGSNSFLYLYIISFVNFIIIYFSINNLKKILDLNQLSPSYLINFNTIEFFLLYASYWGLYYCAIVLRAGIALSILVYISTLVCLPSLSRSQKIQIVGLTILSCTFHITALFGVFAIIIIKTFRKLTNKSYLLLLLIASIIFLTRISTYIVEFLLQYLSLFFSLVADTDLKKLESYEDVQTSSQISFRYIFCLLIALFLIATKKMPLIYYKYLNVYIIGIIIGAIFSSIEAFARISDFFLIYSFILLGIRLCAIHDKNKRLASVALIVFIQFLFVYRTILGL